MKRTIQPFFMAVALFAASAGASTVTVSIDHHAVVAPGEGRQRILRTSFLDETLLATVKLDVYALPQLPSTRAHLTELQRLSPETWWEHLRWDVREQTSGASVTVEPRLVASSFRSRGPQAAKPADRDTSVDCSSHEARFDLGRLPAGDYTVRVSIEGLESPPFPVALRTGLEPEVRDVYLQEKARAARDWDEFKTLQLERLKLDPTKAAALVELAERSLVSGTLEESADYFKRAAEGLERNIAAWAEVNPEDATRQAPGVAKRVGQMRALLQDLPDYFAHRAEWQIGVDAQTGDYVIRSRRDGRVVRVVGAER